MKTPAVNSLKRTPALLLPFCGAILVSVLTARGQHPPVLTIAPSGGNHLQLTITNANPALRYDIYRLPAPHSTRSTWNWCATGAVGQSNWTIEASGDGVGFFGALVSPNGAAVSNPPGSAVSPPPRTRVAFDEAKPAGPVTWFADAKNGHDSLDGRSRVRNAPSGPFATISRALSKTTGGDSITIAAGIYHENIDLRGKDVSIRIEGVEVILR